LGNNAIKSLDKDILEKVGFGNTAQRDYSQKNVVLRDGREAIVWVHKQTGHGILDSQFWEAEDFYEKRYRDEVGPEIGKKTDPAEHLQIYRDLNKKQFSSFSNHLTEQTRFLEIGCSFGGVLNRVTDFGVDVCHGIEPNKQDVCFVQNHNRQAKIYNTTFDNAILQEDFYDMVVSIEVLEHVISPYSFLQKCSSIMRSNGTLHLEVPNHCDVLLCAYKDTGYDRFYYHKSHIHHFTKESLQKLCFECGFSGKVFSFLMYPFFNHVWWNQNHGPQSSAALALPTPIPTRGITAAEKSINDFYKRVESEYERLINSHGLGSCLIFQGKKI